MERFGIKKQSVDSFACDNLQGVGTPLIFSRRGDGGEVLEMKSYLIKKVPLGTIFK
jgi:hypothetical protein